MLDTAHLLSPTTFPEIRRKRLETLQVNLGYLCNQTCQHCHVNAGPKRTELMDRQTIELVLAFLEKKRIKVLDLTGGAPELNPNFRFLVAEARKLGVQVLDRCNLTVLSEPGQEDLADYLAEQGVTVVASLPCYLEENVDAQRGSGVFQASISGLRQLNSLGYGRQHGLELNLVFNPQGPVLPPDQIALESDYKKKLVDDYGIHFNQLFTIANMPISRFGSQLLSKGEFADYMQLLKTSYSRSNLETVMCLSLLSVDWQGFVFDCDFNQMLKMPVEGEENRPMHLQRLMEVELEGMPIKTADHCYGCTAGQGSSCGGALA